jgi:formylglycine-generating enzyme
MTQAHFVVPGERLPWLLIVDFDEVEQRVCDIASKQLYFSRDRISPESRLIDDLGCESLDMVELFLVIEEEFSITLPDDPANPVSKAVFTRQPFRLADLAELVYLYQGTGRSDRSFWRNERRELPAFEALPFTHLDGRWERPKNGEQRLFEPLKSEGPLRQYRRRSDGMRCLLIPSASVELGSDSGDALADERPMYIVDLSAFLIDAEPVSTTAYCRFLNSVGEVGHHVLADWFVLAPDDDRNEHVLILFVESLWRPVPGTERWPMILVSWYGANAYSLWANGRDWTKYQGSTGAEPESFLPSEAQWEYAARGAFYHHMAGNVWQWCSDWYDEGFYKRHEGRADVINLAPTKVKSERGGSWVGPAELCRSSYRRGRPPLARGQCLGFRCIGLVKRAK